MSSPGHKAIDHDFDIVLMMFSQNRGVAQVDDFAVNAGTQVTFLQQVLEEISKLTFLILHDGSEDLILSAGRLIQQAINDLIGRLSLNRLAGNIAIALPDSRVEHSQVVKNLRDRPHRTARIATGGFLLNRNRWSEPGDRIHIGLGHLSEELASIRRQ